MQPNASTKPTMPTDIQLECSHTATPEQVLAFKEVLRCNPDRLLRAGICDYGYLIVIYQTASKQVVSAVYNRSGELCRKQFYKSYNFNMCEPVDYIGCKTFD
jgi:hypothetical protein